MKKEKKKRGFAFDFIFALVVDKRERFFSCERLFFYFLYELCQRDYEFWNSYSLRKGTVRNIYIYIYIAFFGVTDYI